MWYVIIQHCHIAAFTFHKKKKSWDHFRLWDFKFSRTDISEDSVVPSPELKMEANCPSESQLILYSTTWSHNLLDYSSFVLLGAIYIHKMTLEWCSYLHACTYRDTILRRYTYSTIITPHFLKWTPSIRNPMDFVHSVSLLSSHSNHVLSLTKIVAWIFSNNKLPKYRQI